MDLNEPLLKHILFPPYIKCPFCGKQSFAMASISTRSYWRRCFECGENGQAVKLPPLNKKLVYLDQFAISEMMKVLNATFGKQDKVDPYWLTVFEKLDRLIKLQLIACPSSDFHYSESVVAPRGYAAMRQMYSHLSHGSSFKSSRDIRLAQAHQYLEFKAGKRVTIFDRQSNVIDGDYYGWQDRLRFDFKLELSDAEIQAIKDERDAYAQGFDAIYDRWRSESAKSYKDWYKEEGLAAGKVLLKTSGFMLDLMSRPLFPSLDDKTRIDNLVELMLSEDAIDIPITRLSASLWAQIAHQIASGYKGMNKGLSTDIEMISAITPYVDAIFVDQPMYNVINNAPGSVNQYIDSLGTKVFSLKNRDEFLAWLDAVEKEATPEHLALVAEIYGEDWPTPFTSMYDVIDIQ